MGFAATGTWGIVILVVACATATQPAPATFDVQWPMVGRSKTAVLVGQLHVAPATAPGVPRVAVSVTLTRHHATDAHRETWNRLTRVPPEWGIDRWDAARQWRWPNLARLFTLRRLEYAERYGGTNHAKSTNDDFGALLVRTFVERDGAYVETESSRRGPLVTATWQPVGDGKAGMETVVHGARTESMTPSLPAPRGRLKAWLVFADMAGQRPHNWPAEFRGAAVAAFHVDWTTAKGGGLRWEITRADVPGPPEETGFAWDEWVKAGAPERVSEASR